MDDAIYGQDDPYQDDPYTETDDAITHDTGYLSVSHFMFYRKIAPEERLNLADSCKADYAAHDLLYKVKPGDVLWLVNVHLGQLFLIGRLQVEVVVDNVDVAQELVDDTIEAWREADWYAIANRYTIEPMREMNITHLAPHLRFHSRTDRLELLHGVDANQFRSVRRLTAQTANMLQDLWYDDAYTPQTAQDYLEFTEDDNAYAEGRVVVRTLRERQRSRYLVERAKTQRKVHEGRLICEVCGFDFTEVYGIEYIEAHHTEPIGALQGETYNTTSDLAMLCANCHRVIHSQTPPLTVDELRAIVQARRSEQ